MISFPCDRCGVQAVTVEGNTCAGCLVPGEYETFVEDTARQIGVEPSFARAVLDVGAPRRHTSN